MREITSAVLIADSFHRRTSPDSAYGGLGICAGTVRIGLTAPGRTLPSSGLWQRLYLRPLPHQQDSFAAGGIAGGEVGDAVLIRFKATANQPTGLGFKSLTCNSDDFLARVDLSSARPFQSLRNTHSTIGGLVATKEGEPWIHGSILFDRHQGCQTRSSATSSPSMSSRRAESDHDCRPRFLVRCSS